ncbi:MAG: RHS domain-containing protein [Sandaracinaceae bacterium]|nr:RHS domain-containing protein [Sandaracinaceae bacterium]
MDYAERTLRVEWDREGLLRSVVWLTPEGQRQLLVYEYDRYGFLLGGKDAYGKAFAFSYDDAGYMTRKVNRRGHAFEYAYDGAGRCTRARGEHGEVALLLTYLPTKQCTLVTHEENGAQWWYRYEPTGTLLEIEDPYGGIRSFQLDERGQPVAEVDATGQVYPYVRDAAGAVLGKRDPTGHVRPLDAAPHEVAAALEYEGPEVALEWEHGRLVPLGFDVPWSGSLPPQVPAAARAALAGAEVAGVEREHRDAFDTLVRVEKSMGGEVLRRTYRYDGTGNLERYTDFDGGTWEYVFREWTACVEAHDPLGGVTRFERSGWNDLLGVVDPGGTESRYEYDLKRRLVTVQRHDKVRERYTYDAVDRLSAKLRGDGTPLVQYTHGPGALLQKRATCDGQEETFEHDARGYKTLAANAAGECRFEHTAAGRRKADLRDDEGVRVRFAGERVLGIQTLGVGVQYHYPSGDTVLVVDPTDRVHRVQRLGAGIVQRDLASGVTEVSQHDGRGHCLSKTRFRGGADRVERPWTRRFWRSGEGDLRAREDSLRGTTRYAYDAAHRLATVTHADGRQEAYTHDAAGNLRAKPGLRDAHVGGRDDGLVQLDRGNRLYRANGDRFEYDERDHVQSRSGTWGKLVYEHDALDRLRRISFAAAEAGEAYPPGHPAYGLEIHRYGAPETVWEADYDALGRRTEVRAYGRDADGARVCERSRFWWYGDRLAAEEGPTGSLRVYVYIDERALVPFMAVDYASREEATERPEDGERYYYFTDHRGCPERVEDDDGEVVWEATVHPYGECEVHVGADFHQPLRFPGHYHDATTGLHCNRFRYYSPELGRYLESDPIGIQGGLNLYGYCADGNPLRDVDLRGLSGCPDDCPPQATPEGGADSEGTGADQTATSSDVPPSRRSLDDMGEAELQEHCRARADELRAEIERQYDARTANNCTVCVAVVEPSNGGRRRVVVTTSRDDGRLPPRARGALQDGESNPPTRPALRERQGQLVEVDPDTNDTIGGYTRGNANNDYSGDTRHHGEQRALYGGAMSEGERVVAASHSNLGGCCPGCRRAMGSDADVIDPARR